MIFLGDNLCYGCFYVFIYAWENTESTTSVLVQLQNNRTFDPSSSLFRDIVMYRWGWRGQHLLTCGFDVPNEVQQQHIEAAKIATTTSAKDNTAIKADKVTALEP